MNERTKNEERKEGRRKWREQTCNISRSMRSSLNCSSFTSNSFNNSNRGAEGGAAADDDEDDKSFKADRDDGEAKPGTDNKGDEDAEEEDDEDEDDEEKEEALLGAPAPDDDAVDNDDDGGGGVGDGVAEAGVGPRYMGEGTDGGFMVTAITLAS